MKAKTVKTDRRWFCICAIASFMLLVAALLLIILESPASGYELSFYGSVSPLIWVFLIISIIGGIIIIVHQAFADNKKSHWWLVGFVVLMLNYFIITIMPALRGYVLYGSGDILSHAGTIQDLVSTGHFEPDNFYPITHILAAQLAQICSIDYIVVMNYAPAVFAFLYMLGLYLLSTAMLQNRGQVLLVTVSGALLIAWGHISLGSRYGLFPTSMALLMVPFILYLYFKHFDTSKKMAIEFSVLLILMLVLFPFFHPFATVMLCLTFIIIELSKVLYTRITMDRGVNKGNPISPMHRVSIFPAVLLFIVFFMWMSERQTFAGPIQNVYTYFSGELAASSRGAMMSESLGKLGLAMFDTVILGLKMFGDHAIYAILGIIGAVIIMKSVFSSRDVQSGNLFTFVGCFAICALALLIMLPQNLGFTPMRVLGFISIFSTVLGGFALYELFKKRDRYKAIYATVVILIIAFTAVIGVFHTYNSPYTMRPNDQITEMEMRGFYWAFSYSDQDSSFISFTTTSDYRFADAILGRSAAEERRDIQRKPWLEGYFIQDHFNYSQYQTFGESFDKDKYIVITKRDVLCYTELWPQIERFNEGDFAKLETDPSVNKLYSNSEVKAYRVLGLKEL
jgi:hypothetical protein